MSASKLFMTKKKNKYSSYGKRDEELRQYLLDMYGPDMIIADGLSDAFLCVTEVNGIECCVYDRDKVVSILKKRDHMKDDEAWEYFNFNIGGAHVGPRTPLFINAKERKEVWPDKVY